MDYSTPNKTPDLLFDYLTSSLVSTHPDGSGATTPTLTNVIVTQNCDFLS